MQRPTEKGDTPNRTQPTRVVDSPNRWEVVSRRVRAAVTESRFALKSGRWPELRRPAARRRAQLRAGSLGVLDGGRGREDCSSRAVSATASRSVSAASSRRSAAVARLPQRAVTVATSTSASAATSSAARPRRPRPARPRSADHAPTTADRARLSTSVGTGDTSRAGRLAPAPLAGGVGADPGPLPQRPHGHRRLHARAASTSASAAGGGGVLDGHQDSHQCIGTFRVPGAFLSYLAGVGAAMSRHDCQVVTTPSHFGPLTDAEYGRLRHVAIPVTPKQFPGRGS